MAGYTVCSQVSWLELFMKQKLNLSNVTSISDQVKLYSGDGFLVSVPAQLLLASSSLIRDTFLPEMTGQDVFLPSVKGATLLLLVQLLMSGMTGSLQLLDNIRCKSKEVQEVMNLLQIQGGVALMRVNSRPTEPKCVEEYIHSSYSITVPTTRDSQNSSTRELLAVDSIATDPSCVVENNPVEIDSIIKEEPMEDSLGEGFGFKDGEKKDTVQPLECNICNKTYPNNKSRSIHIRNVHSEKLFPCDHCEKKFILEDNLQKHLRSYHLGNRISCDHCQATFSKKLSMHKHIGKAHLDQIYSCQDCGKKYVLKINLNYHIKSAHGGLQSCLYCTETFTSKQNLARHTKNIHFDKFLVSCQDCGKQFEREESLKRHLRFCTGRRSQSQ